MNIINNPKSWPAAFAVIWVLAWIANSLGIGPFDLDKLREFGVFIIAKYAADSWLNTPKGSI
ncbi:MAG: hypothetical protein H6Q73_934 [Firmicutes bacterium]|nr:hypothetical protein [Bacillota bacterium]